jgi:hypothetical protein
LLTLFTSYINGTENNNYKIRWIIYRDQHNITGFERQLPDKKFIQAKSETILNFPIKTIFKTLNNTSSYSQWMYRCIEARLLDQTTEYSKLLYFAQSAPLGSSDRQVILLTKTYKDINRGLITTTVSSLAHESKQLPSNIAIDERVWMINYTGEWSLSTIDSDHTKISYTAYTDPGGFAPEFIVNREVRRVTFETLKGMTDYLLKLKIKS